MNERVRNGLAILYMLIMVAVAFVLLTQATGG